MPARVEAAEEEVKTTTSRQEETVRQAQEAKAEAEDFIKNKAEKMKTSKFEEFFFGPAAVIWVPVGLVCLSYICVIFSIWFVEQICYQALKNVVTSGVGIHSALWQNEYYNEPARRIRRKIGWLKDANRYFTEIMFGLKSPGDYDSETMDDPALLPFNNCDKYPNVPSTKPGEKDYVCKQDDFEVYVSKCTGEYNEDTCNQAREKYVEQCKENCKAMFENIINVPYEGEVGKAVGSDALGSIIVGVVALILTFLCIPTYSIFIAVIYGLAHA